MLNEHEWAMIQRLWARRLEQDRLQLPRAQRHRNLAPVSAQFIAALAVGLGARRLLEIGGSTGISTIALAVAARATDGKLLSIEIDSLRQAEATETIARLGLSNYVDFVPGDAAAELPGVGEMSFVLIDCNKEDYVRFFDMLKLHPGAAVVADNILSHDLSEYVAYVRSRSGVQSMTLPIGKGLEVSIFPSAASSLSLNRHG